MIVLSYDNIGDSFLRAATSMIVSVGHNIDESFCFTEQGQRQWEAAVMAASSYDDIDDSFAGSNVDDPSGGSNDINGDHFRGLQHQGEFGQSATKIALQ